MIRYLGCFALAVCGILPLLSTEAARAATVIVYPKTAPFAEKLAAKEIRRYVYLRCGTLLPIATEAAAGEHAIVLMIDPALAAEEFELKTANAGAGRKLTISGGSPLAVLYGAYQLAEKLGVQFYLHGDVIPDEKTSFLLPVLDERHKPLFATRGIQPFHDFPEGPDWWNQDDYKTYVTQLAKLKMNLLGLHTYPENGPNAEPLVWIGLPQDVNADGTVKFSYRSYWASTPRNGAWGYAAAKTSDFSCGASLLFPDDAYGPDCMKGLMPYPQTPQQCNELFNRTGAELRGIFALARRLGVKTCVGTETPLVIPAAVREHLKQLGKNPSDPAVVRELYEGMFKRIAALGSVDYYWLWTPEGWTWGGNNPAQLEATIRDIRTACEALAESGKKTTLATCGWVLGPQHDRAALDKLLPKACPMSCINRSVGHDPVESAFANIQGRPKWAIPWMENDPNLVAYQPWAGRMRHDAVDARRLGCDGLLGIRWRTKALSANVSALAAAAWDQSWVPATYDVSPVKPIKSHGVGGNLAHFTATVAGADVQAVYQNVRYGMPDYNLTVPNGVYTVTLKFNEPHYAAAGKRVFSVYVQGKPVVENLDMFAKVGKNNAYDVKTPAVKVIDGNLKIDFFSVVEFPCIAGIVVEGTTEPGSQTPGRSFVRKINCGGPAVAGYEADLGSGDASPVYAQIKSPLDQRAMPIAAFYENFASVHFGSAVAVEAGKILASVDGAGARPDPAGWATGPGDLKTDATPLEQIKTRFEHVARFAALRGKVLGAGNLERFDYWSNMLKANALMCEIACIRGQLAAAANKINAEKSADSKKRVAGQALPMRIALARKWEELMAAEIATVSTPGELGTIANLEQHSRMQAAYLTGFDGILASTLGKALPGECAPSHEYTGPARIIVPTVRTSAVRGEALKVRIIALDKRPMKEVNLHVRPLGGGTWQEIAARHVARAVYEAALPAASDDFEYNIVAWTADGQTFHWPVTAPALSQTVVVVEE